MARATALERSSVFAKPTWLQWGEAALALAVAVIPRILTLGRTFVVNDETLYWDWSNQFVTALLNQDWAATLIRKAYPLVTVMWVQTLGFGLRGLWAWLTGSLTPQFYQQLALDRPLEFELLAQRRLPMVLVNAGIVVLIYLYARRLLGRKTALVAAILIGLDPFYLSDARTMRGDSLMAGLMTLSVLSLLLSRRSQSWRQLAFSAITAGLALLTKMSALPVVFLGLVVLLGEGVRHVYTPGSDGWRARLHRFWREGLRPSVFWVTVVVLTFFLLWPALWTSPAQVWGAIKEYAASSLDGRLNYFMGRLTETDLLPLFYPITFLFRATPLTLAGLGLIMAATLNFVYRRRRGEAAFTLEMADLCLLAAYGSIYVGVMTIGLLKRSWYLLPCFPAAMLLAARGWVWLMDRVRWPWGSTTRWLRQGEAFSVAIGSILVIQIVQAVAVHPYYYSYWNPLATSEFVPRLEMLNWGVDVSLSAHWLNAQPNPERLKAAMRPSLRELSPIFRGHLTSFADGQPWAQANFIIVRENHLQLKKHDAYETSYLQHDSPAYTMMLNGVVYGWIYPGPALASVANSRLAGKATLLGYDLPPSPLAAGQEASLNLLWQHKGKAAYESLYAKLVDGGGFTWLQSPVLPLPEFEKDSQTVNALVESQADLRVPAGTPPGLYFLKVVVQNDQSNQLVGEFTLLSGQDQVTVTRTETALALPPLSHTIPHPFGEDLLLLGYNLPETWSASTGVVDLYWQARRPIQKDYVFALRLLNQSGQEVWYRLARPARGIYPTPGWQANEIVRDPWQGPSAGDVARGSYTVELEVYEGDTAGSVGKRILGKVTIATPSESG